MTCPRAHNELVGKVGPRPGSLDCKYIAFPLIPCSPQKHLGGSVQIEEIGPLYTKTAQLQVENTVTIWKLLQPKALQNYIQLLESQRLRVEMGLAVIQ